MRIRFTPSAREQLLSVVDFIRQDNPLAARTFRICSETALRRLQSFPESGRRIPEFPDLAFREILVGSYRIFYRVEGEVVWIVVVWHGAQLPSRP